MDHKGPRMRGPPCASFRHRGGGLNPINHHIALNQLHQPPQRYIPPPNMNQPPHWNTQNPVNTYPAQEENVNYPQPPYNADVAGYNNYYPQGLPSPEVMNATPQPQNFPPYGQQMYLQPQIFAMDPVCFQQPPIVTTPPMVSNVENVPQRKFPYKIKDTYQQCANCGHKNVLAETEVIKRDDEIESMKKELDVFRKQVETFSAESDHWRRKYEALLSQKQEEKESERGIELQTMQVEITESSTNESEILSDEAKKWSQLSPDAIEFNPKSSKEAAEVPVVSAKGMDEDADAPIPTQGSEASTQVEENLFEETAQNDVSDVALHEPEAGSSTLNLPEEVTVKPKQHSDWSEEMENTAQIETSPESKMEQVKTEVAPVANYEGVEDPPVSNSASEQWRGNSSHSGSSSSDHWQQHRYRDRKFGNRGNKFRGGSGPPHSGRGRGGQNEHEHRGYNDNQHRHNNFHPHPRNDRFGNQNNQNMQRHWNNEENRDRPRDNHQRYNNEENRDRPRDGYQRYNNEENRGRPRDSYQRSNNDGYRDQRFGGRNEEHQKQTDEQENRSRERENCSREWSFPQKYDDGSRQKDIKEIPQRPKDGTNRENTDTKNTKETRPQGLETRHGKDNFNVIKDEHKEMPTSRGSQNQNQGNYPSNNYRRITANVEFPNIVKEQTGDLFSAPVEFSLAHCVAQDFRMGSGIAVKFKNEFKRVAELLDQNVRVGGCAHLEVKGRYIFYLVTKDVSTGKPKMDDLRRSLEVMKGKCLNFDVKKLAMPRIGCGLDRLDWSRVKSLINEIFQDAGIEIQIYEFNVEGVPEGEGPKTEVKLEVKYREMKLVNIKETTALLFLGTESGHMDATAKSLNEKFHFEMEYRKAKKTVGNVWCYETPRTNYDWVFSLIIAKTPQEKVLFKDVEACCSQLSKMLRKNEFYYAGIEFPQGWSDDNTFFEKILTLLRVTLYKRIELWVCFPDAKMDFFKMVRDKDGKGKGSVNSK